MITNSTFIESFKRISERIHNWAKGKGFWEEGSNRNDAEMIALMHSELSEALEWLRKKPSDQCPKCTGESKLSGGPGIYYCNNGHEFKVHPGLLSDHIPDYLGIEEELADVIIRIMDMAQSRRWRVAEALLAKLDFNETREYKHGKKF